MAKKMTKLERTRIEVEKLQEQYRKVGADLEAKQAELKDLESDELYQLVHASGLTFDEVTTMLASEKVGDGANDTVA